VKRCAAAILWRLATLLLISTGLAATANTLSPNGIAWAVSGNDESAIAAMERRAAEHGIEAIDLAAAQRMVESGEVVVLDARKPAEFAAGHLPGAVSMPVGNAGDVFEQLQLLLPPDQPVVVYCSGGRCDDSLALGRFLRRQGLKDVRLFAGGMDAWRSAGLEEAEGR